MDFGSFVSGLLTGLREGVEAALIVAIVLAYLHRTGNGGQSGKVWIGASVAVVLSAILGIAIYSTVGAFKEPYEQIFEATTMLLAAAVVTWMLFWMRRQSAGIKGELQSSVDKALIAGGAWGLSLLAFAAVIREGVETALFLAGQATSAASGASSILAGAIVGLLIAAVIGYGFYRGSRRVNLAVVLQVDGHRPHLHRGRAPEPRRPRVHRDRRPRQRAAGPSRRSTSAASCPTTTASGRSCGRSSATRPTRNG